MAITSSQIRDNPWWKRAELIRDDPDLVRLAAKPVQYAHSLPFDLNLDAVYTLRGPRQVGKSTLLKRIIAELLLKQGVAPRRILYLDVEGAGIRDASRLTEEIGAFLESSRSLAGDDRLYLFLDEVTGVPDWGTFVRVLYRRGFLAGAVAIVTGSHALDLQRGSEMAPGRRGEELGVPLDWVMRPLGFREYAQARDAELQGALPGLDPTSPSAAHETAAELRLHHDRLSALFDRYLLTGGFPHAFTSEADAGRIPASVYRMFRDAIVGQMRRAGHRESLFLEVLSWAGESRLGREFSWRDVAAETEIGSKDTARSYLEDAEAMFLWHIFYRTKSLERPRAAPRSPKKLYPADPFTWHSLASWTYGEPDPWAAALDRIADPARRGELVESVVADHIRRLSGREGFYYRTASGTREVDFVFLVGGRPAFLEVKHRRRITGSDARALSACGGGIIATKDQYDWRASPRVALVPVCVLLAGLEGAGSLVASGVG